MSAHQSLIAALIVALIVFAGLSGLALSVSDSLSPEYFDTAGKYIHRL